jgi:YhcH/YjgK/YiaL family protein
MRTLFFILMLNITTHGALAQTDAQKWLLFRTYLNGLKLSPHQSVNAEKFARQYKENQAQWDQVFAYLKITDLSKLKEGRQTLPGSDLYINISRNENKELKETAWEAHRKVIDLQYVFGGAEKIGVATLINAEKKFLMIMLKISCSWKWTVPFTPRFRVSSSCFPGDAHRPMIRVDSYQESGKIAMKIPVR